MVLDSIPVALTPDIRVALAAGAFVLAGCARERPPVEPVPSNGYSAPSIQGSGTAQSGLATYYAPSLAGRRTASGERYDPSQLTAAHRKLPFGTMVEVRRPDGRAVVVRINDRGPYGANRIIDLSWRAAEELGIVKEGKVMVEVRPLPAARR